MVIAVGPPCKASDAEREGREGIVGGVFYCKALFICGLKATPQAAVPWEEACTSRSPSFCSLTIQPSDCISSPRRNTVAAPGHAGDRSAHWHTAQLSPRTRHASHISHIRGHHHMQSGCMCLVFKREKAEGLKSMLCEVQSFRLKLVACCSHAVGSREGMLH